MQNWNQWQLPTAPVPSTSMPQPPVGYPAPGADPMATMQSYMQYYSQPVSNRVLIVMFFYLDSKITQKIQFFKNIDFLKLYHGEKWNC